MKILNRAFRCEHCGKLYERKFSCESHEFYCMANPLNRSACDVCDNASEFNKYSIWCKNHKKEYVMPSNLRPAFAKYHKISCKERTPVDCADFDMSFSSANQFTDEQIEEFEKQLNLNPF